jgi:2-amino-4-hydroxy-6-hydroxymethyldihydropteridine diphosphokinase
MTERRAVIALGANLGDREASFARAMEGIEERIGEVLARSAWRETPPLVLPGEDPADHPPYLNGVVVVETALAPLAILAALHAIERELGRDRRSEEKRWQPRLVDLDLVAVDDLVIEEPGLTLPHPRMQDRDFVLGPLVEVWPDWRHPLLGLTAAELLARLSPRL